MKHYYFIRKADRRLPYVQGCLPTYHRVRLSMRRFTDSPLAGLARIRKCGNVLCPPGNKGQYILQFVNLRPQAPMPRLARKCETLPGLPRFSKNSRFKTYQPNRIMQAAASSATRMLLIVGIAASFTQFSKSTAYGLAVSTEPLLIILSLTALLLAAQSAVVASLLPLEASRHSPTVALWSDPPLYHSPF